MDVGSIIAITGAVFTVIEKVHAIAQTFVTAPDVLQQFIDELQFFRKQLDAIAGWLQDDHKKALVKQHAENLEDILKGGKKAVDHFQEVIAPPNKTFAPKSMRNGIRLVLEKETFITARSHMVAIAHTIQLCLQRVNVDESLRIRQSQERTEKEIQNLSKIVNLVKNQLSRLDRKRVELESWTVAEEEDMDEEMSQTLVEATSGAELVREYLSATENYELTAKEDFQTVYSPDNGSVMQRVRTWLPTVTVDAAADISGDDLKHRKPSHTGLSSMDDVSDTESSDPLPEEHDPDILDTQVDILLVEIEEKLATSDFVEAERLQLQAIETRKQLRDSYNRVFRDEASMCEQLVNIYRKQATPQSLKKGRDLLRSEIHREESQPQKNILRISKLQFTVARLYYDESKLEPSEADEVTGSDSARRAERSANQAITNALSAFNKTRDLEPRPTGHSAECVRFIIEAYRRTGNTTMAKSYAHIHRDLLASAEAAVQENTEQQSTKQRRDSVPQVKNDPFAMFCLRNGFGTYSRNWSTEVNRRRETALVAAIMQNDPEGHEATEVLIRSAVDVNLRDSASGETPVVLAIKASNKTALDLLLKADVVLSRDAQNGRTPLHVAVQMATDEAVIMASMIAAKDPSLVVAPKGEAGPTPLHLAVKTRNAKMVKALLEHVISPAEPKDSDSKTPLMYAVENSDRTIASALIKNRYLRGCLDVEDKRRRTPLLRAIELKDMYMVEMLLEHNPDVLALDNAGKDAKALAKANRWDVLWPAVYKTLKRLKEEQEKEFKRKQKEEEKQRLLKAKEEEKQRLAREREEIHQAKRVNSLVIDDGLKRRGTIATISSISTADDLMDEASVHSGITRSKTRSEKKNWAAGRSAWNALG